MIIRAIVNGDEKEFLLERSFDTHFSKKGRETFLAKSTDDENASIVIYAKNGIIKEVQLYGDVTIYEDDPQTSLLVIKDRAQEAIEELLNSEASGLQNDGNQDSNSEPSRIKPYDPDKIKVRQDKFAVDYVVNKLIARGMLDLNPDFQRKFVWDRRRQSRLIESTLLGIPIPFMYLSESVKDKFYVVDGLQRLSTFRDFVSNKFSLRGLEHLTQFDGCYFNLPNKGKEPLDIAMQTRIESFQLYFNIIDKSSPNEVKYDIFERLNTGGLPLNAQEIRNCNAEDKVRNFLKEASNSEEFKTATDNSISSKRLDDQELVLRYTGFLLRRNNPDFNKRVDYSGNMKKFLDEVNEFLNRADESDLNDLKMKFINAMKVCYHLFGRYAFRKCISSDLQEGARKPLINKSMFIVWSVLTSEISYTKIVDSFEAGVFTVILADKMQTKVQSSNGQVVLENSEYNKMFTSGTFDVKTLNNSFNQTVDLLDKYQIFE